MASIYIKCECGDEFEFTEGEQEFYKTKGFSTPKRCQSCRTKKKRERLESEEHNREY